MFETFAAVMMLIVFLVPGYVWRTVEGQFVWLDRRLEWEKFALGLLTRSTFIYLPFSPLLYRAWTEQWYDKYPLSTAGLALFFLLVLPVIEGFALGFAKQKSWFIKINRWLTKCADCKLCPIWVGKLLRIRILEETNVPTAWDSVFGQIDPCWVIVTFKDGSKVYGFFGPESRVSSDHEERDIFISQTVVKNGNKLEFVPNTAGVYIRGDEIKTVEFIKQ